MKTRFLLPLALCLAALGLVLALPALHAQNAEVRTLSATEAGAGLLAGEFLAGASDGLWKLGPTGAGRIWDNGEVKKILRTAGSADAAGGWYLLSSKGIFFSSGLAAFEERNTGLPVKTYKRVGEGGKYFEREVMDLKDLEADPTGRFLITCTKDSVFLSRNGGLSWEDLGSPSPTTGLKAVALAPYPGSREPGAWAAHPIKGLFARKLSASGAWTSVGTGLWTQPGVSNPEELADLVWAESRSGGANPAGGPGAVTAGPASAAAPAAPLFRDGRLWAGNSFQGRVYSAAAATADFRTIWNDGRDFGTAESLDPFPDGRLRFVTQGSVLILDPSTGTVQPDEKAHSLLGQALAASPQAEIHSLAWNEDQRGVKLSELWLLAAKPAKPHRAAAENRHGLYLATGFVANQQTRGKYLSLMAQRGLDSIVVDMKDDYGRLRFAPQDPLLKKMGKTGGVLDVEAFVKDAKARGIYLIARVVVFKDEALAAQAGGRYAIWDEKAKAPWRGYRTVKVEAAAPQAAAPQAAQQGQGAQAPSAAPLQTSYERQYYDERWVDPYSEEVWAYNVAIANEIVARGFDEVQFDYIRFPTDGENLGEASFRWRDQGMDKESALASFLRFARERIAAPISIDIYGANGWYRSGVRTGQDVELLAKYVDVICPMLYPSHFEQGFLAGSPAEERPYRIYRLGTLRNSHIARGRVAVRPYVQAFFLNVSYDRTYYNLDYVKRQVTGIRDADNLGMTFWNNSGRYDDIPVLELKDGKLLGVAGWKGGPQPGGPRPENRPPFFAPPSGGPGTAEAARAAGAGGAAGGKTAMPGVAQGNPAAGSEDDSLLD